MVVVVVLRKGKRRGIMILVDRMEFTWMVAACLIGVEWLGVVGRVYRYSSVALYCVYRNRIDDILDLYAY